MSIAKLILLLLVLGALVVFALENWLPAVPLVILGSSTVALPLAVWILGAIAAGALTTLVVTLLLRLGGGGNVPSRRRSPVQPNRDRTESVASGRADRPQWSSPPFAGFSRQPTAEKAAAASDRPRSGAASPRRPADSWESFSRPRTDWEDWQRYEEPIPTGGDRPPTTRVSPPSQSKFEPEFEPELEVEFEPEPVRDTGTRIRDREDRVWSDWDGYDDYLDSRGEDVRPMGDRAADYYREVDRERGANREEVDREEFYDRQRDRQYGHGWEAARPGRAPAPEPPLEPELVEEEADYQDYIVDYGDEDEIDRYDRELGDRATYGSRDISDDFEDFEFTPAEADQERTGGDRPTQDSETRRPIQEIQREPKVVSQSGSLYSYSYRRPEQSAASTEPAADAAEPDYRILTPPYRPSADPPPATDAPPPNAPPSNSPPSDGSPSDQSPP
ncbi:MAG: hypothetical protein VKK04_19315 [Synechococcales bacterium]|nr:hypothetical protein [Synechococcales bacterium]